MKAMVLTETKKLLVLQEIPVPIPGPDQVLIEVEACGVCRTDLHIAEGDLGPLKAPLIPGHQAVGKIVKVENEKDSSRIGERVGVFWLAKTCGHCGYCCCEKENLCDDALFTGYDRQGGFAEYLTCESAYTVPLPTKPSAAKLAPLLCAGIIGFRAYKACRDARTIGFYGFGSSAHILLQIVKAEGKRVFVFTRKTDIAGRELARKLGAVWVGNSDESPPEKLEAVIVFAPVGELMIQGLRALQKGGICVSAGIVMSKIPSFPYEDLFFEKTLTTVSHMRREDALNFFKCLEGKTVETTVHTYPLEEANVALADLKEGHLKGSIVLTIK